MKKLLTRKSKLHIADVSNSGKQIRSVVAVGDVIEVEQYGEKHIYKVEKFDVRLNNPYTRPIDFVIHVKLSYNHGISSIECTSDKFKYIRHISHCC